MNSIEMKKGSKFLWKKVLYEILDINDLFLYIQKFDDLKIYRISQEEFYNEYRGNFITPYIHSTESYNIDLNSLDDIKRENAIRIAKYLFLLKKIDYKNVTELMAIRDKVAEEIGDPKPPSRATLYRWKNKYIIENKLDFRAFTKKNIRKNKLDDEIIEIIKKCINDMYLNESKISIRKLHRTINNKIWEKNIKEGLELKEPSFETIRQYVNYIDKKTIVLKREGSLEALIRYKTYKQGIKADRILEYIEIDHVFLKIEVNYNDIYLGTPVLTLLIDNFSLSILGLYIGFGKPNTYCIINALKSALLPKSYVYDKVVKTNSEWIQLGGIENLICDNAKEFHSKDFETICLELGINLQYAPPYHAWYKRYVENFFGAFDKKLLSNLPGSYKNIQKKTLSYDYFIKILYTYIIDIYHNNYIERKKGTPYSLWNESVQKNPIILPFGYDDINIIISSTLERTITKSGISIDNVFYNDDNLNFIKRNHPKNSRFKIKRNLDDISYIYVYSNFENKYIKVYAVDQEYTKNKTVFQHHCILKIARKESKNSNSRAIIHSAEKAINQYIEDGSKIKKNIKRKDKILHYKNISSSTFQKVNNKDSYQKENLNYNINKDPIDIEEENDEWSVFKRD